VSRGGSTEPAAPRSSTQRAKPGALPPLAQRIAAINRYLVEDCLGGPRPWKLAWVINFQKGGTAPFLLLLMALYGNFSTGAWIYLALHGGYGLVWLLKEAAFPDPAWQKRVTIAGGLMAFAGVLGWYWVIGWLLIARPAPPVYPLPDGAWFAACILLCLLGSVIMMTADAQKYFTLRLRRGLITGGLFARIRHPNYLGEMMIYGSFALLAWHWLAFLILAWVWLGVFAVNMLEKEASLARHDGWEAYRARSGWIFPPLGRQPGATQAGTEQ
jgi:protein-S-isoprenylcysteine O-methyltransferase Ste14